MRCNALFKGTKKKCFFPSGDGVHGPCRPGNEGPEGGTQSSDHITQVFLRELLLSADPVVSSHRAPCPGPSDPMEKMGQILTTPTQSFLALHFYGITRKPGASGAYAGCRVSARVTRTSTNDPCPRPGKSGCLESIVCAIWHSSLDFCLLPRFRCA